MTTGFAERVSVSEMIEKSQHLSFLGRRTFVPRPLSEATEIYDTDFEDDMSEDQSPASLDSRSTLSSVHEARTPPPHTSELGQFDFRFAQSQTEEAEFVIALSPADVKEQRQQQQQQPLTALNAAVAQLDESQVFYWTTEEVAEWMTEAGFEDSVVDKFLMHDISGEVLLDLQFQDLKELDIGSFGKRHQVMSSIQQLRTSSMFSAASGIKRQPSTSRSPRSERRRRTRQSSEDVVPEESISIVAIEQLLPKPHKCSRGEVCPKHKRYQEKVERIEAQFAEDIKSIAAPSVVASSDVLGPAPAFTITAERLSEILPRDPQDNVRHFLNFQHVNSPIESTYPATQITQRLNGLPKLTIPTSHQDAESPCRTPISALRNPTAVQTQLRAELQNDPYHYGGVASPVDVYRIATPMSATDVPITALAVDPCEREVSQSVPPEMKYGARPNVMGEPIARSQSTGRKMRRPSFLPAVAPVRESSAPLTPPVLSEEELANHAGWMRHRKTTRMMRHEWQEHYFNLHGSKLDVFENEQVSKTMQSIDVDDYVLHAYSTASSSKLSAAFKKSIGAATAEPTFAFSLIPEQQKNKKFFEKEKSHHFAVNSGKDRVEWMRKLMLAKAMKKNDGQI